MPNNEIEQSGMAVNHDSVFNTIRMRLLAEKYRGFSLDARTSFPIGYFNFLNHHTNNAIDKIVI